LKFGERRPAEIGVQDDAGCVDHTPQGWRFQPGEIFFDTGFDGDGIGVLAGADLLADCLQHAPYFVHDQAARKALVQVSEIRKDMIHGRQIAQLFFGGQVTMLS
jgi:hypothetical protein